MSKKIFAILFPMVALSQKIGDTGPAGGLIFYDKGSISDGWRYLEAAPRDQSKGIQWYNGTYKQTDSPVRHG